MLHECMQQHNLVAPNVAELESTQLKCNSNGDGVCGVVPSHPLPASHTGSFFASLLMKRIERSPTHTAKEPAVGTVPAGLHLRPHHLGTLHNRRHPGCHGRMHGSLHLNNHCRHTKMEMMVLVVVQRTTMMLVVVLQPMLSCLMPRVPTMAAPADCSRRLPLDAHQLETTA